MIEITEAAQQYFERLIEQQDEEGLGLRLSVHQPGTPHAGCDLHFCPHGQQRSDDRIVELPGFRLFVAADSERWLEDAQIDFEKDSTGGQLTIRAPGIRGHEPASSAPIEERVQWLLDVEINPALAAHRGHVSLVEVTSEMQVVLQFGGGCHGCGMADVTLKQGIQQTLTQKIPEITAVLDATDHRSGSNPFYAPGTRGRSAV